MTRPQTIRGLAPDLTPRPIALNLRALSIAEGIRAALAVAVIIAANEYLQWPSPREAALAALLTCLCDPGGPVRRRVPILLGFTLVGGLITAGFGLARGFGMPVALPLGVFAVFCASFARIYGQEFQQAGALTSVVVILSLDRAVPGVGEAAILGGAFVAGGLWALLLTLVIWRTHPFLPARRAVAETYRQLALMAAELYSLLHAGITDELLWEANARVYRRQAREAIEGARILILETLRARGAASDRAQQSLIRLEAAEQLFGALIALSELAEQAPPAERPTIARLARRLRPLLLVLGDAIVNDAVKPTSQIGRAIDKIAAGAAALPAASPLRLIVERIVERLRIAQTLTVPANFVPGGEVAGQRMHMRQRLLQPLNANLNWQSPALRHAVRAAVMAAPALAFTMLWFTPYDHWLTITIVATMQPAFGPTYLAALQRVGGTILGGLVAAVVGLFCTTPLTMAAAMFPLAVAALAVRAVSFGLFMLALTPLVVLLVEVSQPGASEWQIAAARALFTAIGGVLAVGSGLLLWPHREPEHLAAEARRAIAAHGRFAETTLAHLLGEVDAAAVDRSRRIAGVASNNLEALISRALIEPGTAARDRLEAALVIDAALRRCAGRLVAMQIDTSLPSSLSPEMWRLWRDWIATSISALTDDDAKPPPRPTGAHVDALDRIARQIDLMAGAVERLSE